MDDFEKKIIEIGSSVSMTAVEREQIRARLLSYTQNKPIPSPYITFFSSSILRHGMSFAFVAVLFFTGGLSAIADKALPGTFLYPLKTQVNEKVLSLFATSPDSKKELTIALAQRRLEEAEKISQDATIPEEVKKEHAKMLDIQLEQALSDEEDITLEKEETIALSVPNETQPAEEISRKVAPVMSMSAPALETSDVPLVSVSEPQMMVEGLITPQDIEDLRTQITVLRSEFLEKKKLEGGISHKISFEAKLLKAQKALFDAKQSSTTPFEKQKQIQEAKKIISNAQRFLENTKIEASSISPVTP